MGGGGGVAKRGTGKKNILLIVGWTISVIVAGAIERGERGEGEDSRRGEEEREREKEEEEEEWKKRREKLTKRAKKWEFM